MVGVDLGGATTDIYSIAEGSPANMGTVMKGIQEPYAKRSVEGDIGMRYSVHGILEAVGDRRLSKIAGINRQKVNELVDYPVSYTHLALAKAVAKEASEKFGQPFFLYEKSATAPHRENLAKVRQGQFEGCLLYTSRCV